MRVTLWARAERSIHDSGDGFRIPPLWPAPEGGAPRSIDLALVGDDLAVVRQASRNDEIDGALELGEILQRRPDRRLEGVGRRGSLGRERHRVGFGLAGHDKPQALELGMAPPDLGHLLGAYEHALDLRGLIGAAHPALDAQVGAPARARAGERRREVAEREADLRVMRIEVRDHDLADIALGDRVAGDPGVVELTSALFLTSRSCQ